MRAALAATAVVLVLLAGPGAAAGTSCRSVQGTYDEEPTTDGCTSPVDLCIAATYQGDLRGTAFSQATSIVPSADPATAASVAFFTSKTRLTTRQGDLLIRNAGAFTSVFDYSIVDLQTIIGGTGGFRGASGSLRATGTFAFPAGGRSTWAGTLCLP
jgi:hypothetical protein